MVDISREPRPRFNQPSLIRAIGPFALAANAINLTVGAGIFVMPADVAAKLGVSAIWGYVLCGATMALVLACFAEIGSRVADSGGAFAYVHEAFGPHPAFLLGTVMWFGYAAAADAYVANVFINNLAQINSVFGARGVRDIAIIVIIGGLIGLNMLGVQYGSRFATLVTLAKLTPLAVLLIVGLPHVRFAESFSAPPPGGSDLAKGALPLFFVFAGAETALTPSGEIRNPRRTIPLALLIAICTLIALFLGVHLVAQNVLGGALAGHSAPLAATAEQLLGPRGKALLVFGTLLCTFGMLVGDILSTPRAIYATAATGLMPRALAYVHPRFHTPIGALALYGVTICALAVSGAFDKLAIFASVSLLLIYLMVCAASVRIRQIAPTRDGLKLPGGPTIAILACIIIVWFLTSVSLNEWLWLGAMVLVAEVVYWLCRIQVARARD